ncbi:MAG: phosphate signaling complex protein PhoU [Verrucomicrobiota bacterium]
MSPDDSAEARVCDLDFIPQPMITHYEQELTELRQKLLTMAGHAEQAVTRAVRSLTERDSDLAGQVQRDDDVLDQFEIEMDDHAIRLLAKAPLASDLRFVAMTMKISHELERVGDGAVTIARRAVELNQSAPLKAYVDIPRMSDIGLGMLRDALEAFINHGSAQAMAIIPRDKEVDELNRQLHRELAGFMVERPAMISLCLHLMTVSKTLERIADHAKNIAEDVVYLYEGRDVRHPGQGIKQGILG